MEGSLTARLRGFVSMRQKEDVEGWDWSRFVRVLDEVVIYGPMGVQQGTRELQWMGLCIG